MVDEYLETGKWLTLLSVLSFVAAHIAEATGSPTVFQMTEPAAVIGATVSLAAGLVGVLCVVASFKWGGEE